MKLKQLFLTLFVCIGLSSCDKTIEVGIITGHTDKYHNCEKMVPHIEQVFSENANIKTTIIDINLAQNSVIDFTKYDAVIMNINEVEWNDTQKQNFEDYMYNGGGMVVVHEADNAFPEWKAYNEMIGLGGWGGRNIQSGPFYYYSNGEFVTDSLTEGEGGKHGRSGPYEIKVRDEEHPIMKGLPTSWVHYDDELYGNLRGPAQNIHPLATAFSDSTTGGTGKEELVLFTVTYGKGRIFHTVLGHTGKDYDKSLKNNRGFDVTLLRGTEWAATGEVQSKCTF
ncbi:MAG: ThuA domain-containing protein [Rikenellaceae bacterium]